MTSQNEQMLATMRGHEGWHQFGVSKVQRLFGINYNQAHYWMDWLLSEGHAERIEDRPWEVRLI